MAMRTLSREQQRQNHSRRMMLGLQLQAHLRNLAHAIRGGDQSKLPEFQQFVQYATPEMRVGLLEHLESNPDPVAP